MHWLQVTVLVSGSWSTVSESFTHRLRSSITEETCNRRDSSDPSTQPFNIPVPSPDPPPPSSHLYTIEFQHLLPLLFYLCIGIFEWISMWVKKKKSCFISIVEPCVAFASRSPPFLIHSRRSVSRSLPTQSLVHSHFSWLFETRKQHVKDALVGFLTDVRWLLLLFFARVSYGILAQIMYII